jgi:CheY-like chemotaxis protein
MRQAGRADAAGSDTTRVLVVEDDASLREALVAFVEKEGYVADEAADGAEAMRVAEQMRPHVIVLDLMMPGMDGYQVMEALAERYGKGRPRVIVMSGAHRLDLARVRLGADAYLAKPFDQERMRQALQRLLPAPPGAATP